MKKLVALLLVSMMATVAYAGLDTDSDSFGVYFDTAGNVNHLPGGMAMYANTEVYIILMNPSTPIKGFELAYRTTALGAAQFRSAQVIEGGSYVDLGTSSNPLAGDYRCGYAAHRPIVPAMVMVHWTYGNYGADPGVQFFVTGVLTNPSRPGGLPVIDGGPGVGLRVAGISSGDVALPCARTGAGEAPVAEEINSFGAVKSLFR